MTRIRSRIIYLGITKAAAASAFLYLVLTALALWPIFSVPTPCLGDYLNHLARIHVITTIHQSPVLQRFYEVHWTLTPYLGMDVVMVILCKLLPLYRAGQIFLALCVLMPVVSVAALRIATTGRIGLIPAAAFPLCYNYQLSLGFLNYLFSAGLAMLLLAGWLATLHWARSPRSAMFALGVLIVYLSHAFACAAYCIAVAGIEIGRAVQSRFRPLKRITADWLAAACTAVPALCLAVGIHRENDFAGPPITSYGSPVVKLVAALSPVLFPGTSFPTLLILFAALLVILFLTRHPRLSLAVWPAAVSLGFAALIAPNVLIGVWGTDFRLPLLVSILSISAVSLAFVPAEGFRAGAAAIVVVLTFAKSTAVVISFKQMQQQVDSTRWIVRQMPPGKRLLVVDIDDPVAPQRAVPRLMTFQMPILAVIEQNDFLPFLFMEANIKVRSELQSASSPNGGPINWPELQDGLTKTDATPGAQPLDRPVHLYSLGWPEKFDYVLVQHFGAATPNVPKILHKVAATNIATLYNIVNTSRPPS